jgi:hypothetical protein
VAKQKFGWVAVSILLIYLVTHLVLFGIILIADWKKKFRACCCTNNRADDENQVLPLVKP